MSEYASLTKRELESEKADLEKKYRGFQQKNLALDMSRGKPGADQLNLSMGILDCINSSQPCRAQDGTDCRNYGLLDGIPEAKALFAQLLEVNPTEIIVGGNSSLTMMYDTVARAYTHGVLHSEEPWCRQDKIRFLCPSPGYDRHFAICEHFGIEMIPIEMRSDGPDMDAVKRLVESDETVKGIWCVPKYSNPEGVTYSDAVVDRFAALKPKAPDFRIFWDNAYCVHDLGETSDPLKNILEACRKNGREDMVFLFASTSKISFPGSGVAMMAASCDNVAFIKKQMAAQAIGPDKINQLRHVRYFGDIEGIRNHMKKHAAILRPKFKAVTEGLEKELGGTGLAEWTQPNGGYFISLNTPDGCARETVRLCGEAGVKLTPAGATFPYGKDPRDRNIRIAPTYPPVGELKTAIELLCLCVKLAGVERLLSEKK
ncbi:MAG TPA: aminotransferase class I/II-fold pyridoxal phosphate-dependent enzyme [Clostridia bacterium]|nr:aminotransferase class I/II-fold pyridoxal phosphate-dependent enzyme [Clostridia bacterium]